MTEGKYTGFYFAERHLSNPQPEQISAQIIEIYSFENLFWHASDKEYFIPAGRRQRILTMDIGALLPDVADLLNIKEPHRSRKKYFIEDGLQGSRKLRLPEALHNLEQYIISTFEFHEDNVHYYFALRPEAITLERPLEIYITEYLTENKELISFSREKIQVWTKKWNNTDLPRDDFELRHFDTSLPFSKPTLTSKKS